MDIKLFKNISIRGRYAFALRCVENVILKEGFMHPLLNELLQRMWSFVYIEDLNYWYIKNNEITPENTQLISVNQLESVSPQEFEDFKKLYMIMPNYLVKMIDWTWAIGLQNLFSDTGEYSYVTLECLRHVIEIATENSILIPEVNVFLQSDYHENGGQGGGEKQEYLFFMKVLLLIMSQPKECPSLISKNFTLSE